MAAANTIAFLVLVLKSFRLVLSFRRTFPLFRMHQLSRRKVLQSKRLTHAIESLFTDGYTKAERTTNFNWKKGMNEKMNERVSQPE